MSNKGDMMQTFEPDQLVLVRENDVARWRLTQRAVKPRPSGRAG